MRVVLLATAVACSTGCAIYPLHLRADTAVVAPPSLRGMSVAITPSRDARAQTQLVGRHRDGLLRVTQWRWRPAPSVDEAVTAMLRNAVRVAGGEVVAPEQAQLHLAAEVLEAEVTTDGVLAGEETFGRVQLRLVVTDGAGALVSDRREVLAFATDDEQDPEALGAALYEALVKLVGELDSGLPPVQAT